MEKVKFAWMDVLFELQSALFYIKRMMWGRKIEKISFRIKISSVKKGSHNTFCVFKILRKSRGRLVHYISTLLNLSFDQHSSSNVGVLHQ